ncbi:hypothetical protein ACFY7Z_06415 [Streptomyces sp. NPDC012623]|uniref:aromatic-ring hydroxylase C-terminal domain-containing protein n=1 Tax=unclassified Streptomyces TaxID=2593676 RepID=UPI0036BC0572
MLERTTRILGEDRKNTATGFSRRGGDAHQFDLHYRHGPLTAERRGSVPGGGPRAGDRAPDAPCADPAGSPVRLFDVFRGSHFTLLAFSGGPLPGLSGDSVRVCRVGRPGAGPEAADLTDSAGHAHTAYAGEGLFLVRPDGYIGLATRDPAAVTAYLSWEHL